MKEWTCLHLSLPSRDIDLVSGILWELGTQGIEEQSSRKGRSRLKAFFETTYDINAIAAGFDTACRKAGLALETSVFRREREKDWLKLWGEKLRPFPVGKRFYIFPSTDLTGELPENRFPLWLQPGMAFGTGTHESTQLCMEALEQVHLKEKRLLDIGTGSGILAIAAVKLGCRKVVACDVDPEAICVARANSVANQCHAEIDWVRGGILQVKPRSFDVIVANLTAQLILREVGAINDHLACGGRMILSGILNTQLAQVQAALKSTGLTRYLTRRRGEWVCLVARKNQIALAN